ncbi:hypothetical protein PoB_003198300 [Plakobranchus ocellatus]|uniref:Uncharacterized protein n=1 Tax=Plakobranchus ocellatus TaxID=259542 RepID=A0AAV4AFD2_9GAST|nr:hypothetical protein PoB_003198300 [Plakobranchus ocellatus]
MSPAVIATDTDTTAVRAYLRDIMIAKMLFQAFRQSTTRYLRLLGPPSDQGVGTRTRGRRVPADRRAASLSTTPSLTTPEEEEKEEEEEEEQR